MAKLNIDLSNSTAAIATVKKELYSGYGQILGNMLAKYGYDLERFTITVVNALKKNPKLINCTKESLLSAVLASAELGLEIDNPMGYCYMIPFKNGNAGVTEAKFIIGYKGIIELLYRSPKVRKVVSEVVYKKDKFKWVTGSDFKVEHEPFIFGDAGERVATYTIVFLENGEKLSVLIPAHQIEKIKKFSTVPELYGMDKDPTGNMWKKAGIRQIIKYTPKGEVKAIDAIVNRDERVLNLDLENEEIMSIEPASLTQELPQGEFGGFKFDTKLEAPVKSEMVVDEKVSKSDEKAK